MLALARAYRLRLLTFYVAENDKWYTRVYLCSVQMPRCGVNRAVAVRNEPGTARAGLTGRKAFAQGFTPKLQIFGLVLAKLRTRKHRKRPRRGPSSTWWHDLGGKERWGGNGGIDMKQAADFR